MPHEGAGRPRLPGRMSTCQRISQSCRRSPLRSSRSHAASQSWPSRRTMSRRRRSRASCSASSGRYKGPPDALNASLPAADRWLHRRSRSGPRRADGAPKGAVGSGSGGGSRTPLKWNQVAGTGSGRAIYRDKARGVSMVAFFLGYSTFREARAPDGGTAAPPRSADGQISASMQSPQRGRLARHTCLPWRMRRRLAAPH